MGEKNPRWRLPGEILLRPLSVYETLKTCSIFSSLSYLLALGLTTSILSGLLAALVGVDYQNPSNCGGSAQILAHWFTYTWVGETDLIRSISLFIVVNEIGYLLLALMSAPLLAAASFLFVKEAQTELLRSAMSAVCYGMTPGLVLGWVPNPFFIFGVLALGYQALALWKMMGLSAAKSVLVCVVWLVVFGVLQDLAVFIFDFVY
ncbi:hypothetical protein EU545_04395 [Candidatus Thorarchaeota archaeon]|nr:MAG: hypothetical protein EU545_04395 [Candidatus Thorarchaeota archaeon]